MAEMAGPFKGDGRGFDPNADPSQSRGQFVFSRNGEMTFAHVSPSHGPQGEVPAQAFPLNQYGSVTNGRRNGSFTAFVRITNSAMYGVAPAINANVHFEPDGGGGFNISINRDKMPSFGLYHRVNGQWSTVHESEERGALHLFPLFPNERVRKHVP